MSLKHLDGLRVAFHGPMVHRCLGHQGQRVQRDPLPEDHILSHCVSLHLALHLNVKDLQSFLRLECDHFASWIHDCRVSADGASNWIGGVAHVNDNNLRRFAHFLANADEFIRLHGEVAEGDGSGLNADICKLKF